MINSSTEAFYLTNMCYNRLDSLRSGRVLASSAGGQGFNPW